MHVPQLQDDCSFGVKPCGAEYTRAWAANAACRNIQRAATSESPASNAASWEPAQMQTCVQVAEARHAGEDRALVVPLGQGACLLVLADGAGGRAGGAAAADQVLAAARALTRSVTGPDCVRLLQHLDQQLLHIGETT